MSGLGRLILGTLLAGVLVAGLLLPYSVGMGIATNAVTEAIDDAQADPLTADIPLRTTVTDSTGAPIATIYDQNRVMLALERVIGAASSMGYTSAQVSPRLQRDPGGKPVIDLIVDVEQGPSATGSATAASELTIQHIEVTGEGTQQVIDKVRSYIAPLREGDSFDAARIAAARERVRASGLFSDVEFTSDGPTGTLRIHVVANPTPAAPFLAPLPGRTGVNARDLRTTDLGITDTTGAQPLSRDQNAWTFFHGADRYGHSPDRIVNGKNVDLEAADAAHRASGGKDMLWFRIGDKTGVVDDPKTMAKLYPRLLSLDQDGDRVGTQLMELQRQMQALTLQMREAKSEDEAGKLRVKMRQLTDQAAQVRGHPPIEQLAQVRQIILDAIAGGLSKPAPQ